DPAELDSEATLVSLGLDSMGAIELAGQLRGALGASPSVPELLQGASVASAAATLLAALAPAELDQLAADLTALDPAELAALLDELPAASH
ncbi:MAG TPA: acyl carrier protein, partial [Herpetosiphonaceae bacterium]